MKFTDGSSNGSSLGAPASKEPISPMLPGMIEKGGVIGADVTSCPNASSQSRISAVAVILDILRFSLLDLDYEMLVIPG